MNNAAALTDRTFPTASAAYKALRAAGGENYRDPCTVAARPLRNTFVMPCGAIIEVSKRRGCPARLKDVTDYHGYWAGSAMAGACKLVREGKIVTVYAG
jgi:hypothetical protein